MENLILLGEERSSIEVLAQAAFDTDDELVDLAVVPSLGTDDDENIALLTQRGFLHRVLRNEDGSSAVVWTARLSSVVDEKNPKTSGKDQWFSVSCVDTEALICLSRGGAIVSVDVTSGETELVGEFDHGIQAASWSPDSEVLALVTQTAEEEDEMDSNEDGGRLYSALLTMNTEWEVLAEVTVEAMKVSCNFNESISLTWRPDGTALAVSSVDKSDSTRRIRFYQRETLDLQAVGRSEDGSGKVVPNLQGLLAWASTVGCSGLLASVQRKGRSKQQVVFFEPNGLRHREFLLRGSPKGEVKALTWNLESDLLMLCIQDETFDEIQLFHRSNYHWYMCYARRFGPKMIRFCCFHQEAAYVVFVGLANTRWIKLEFCWDVSTIDIEKNSCVASVIDGNDLNVTYLHKALIPPPMFAETIRLPAPIASLAGQSSDRRICHLSDGSFAVIGKDKTVRMAHFPDSSEDTSMLRQLLLLKEDSGGFLLVAVECGGESAVRDSLVELCIRDDTVIITNRIQMEGRILRIAAWADDLQDSRPSCLIEMKDGRLFEFENGSVYEAVEPLLEPCPWIQALRHPPVHAESGDSTTARLVVGRSINARLFCQDRLLCNEASSFTLSTRHGFLSYTTSSASCVIRFLSLLDLANFDPLMGSDEADIEGYQPRHIERGARLIALLPENPVAILQMPRGNLEGIYPRALILPYVMNGLIRCEYKESFNTMRRQKIDLNLVVDLNPIHFLEGGGAEEFVAQVKPIDYLNLFISSLQDYDVTEFKYPIPSWFELSKEAANDSKTGKVNQVCQKLREIFLVLEDQETVIKGHYLLPLLSTFAKEEPPKLEEALDLVKKDAESNHQGKKPPLFSDKAQKAIHYLAFLADYELLFNTALGMYDYDLARAVARNSQMDPKIYLALLRRLNKLPEFYGKFEVDIQLKRFDSALGNLNQSRLLEESIAEFERNDEIAISGNSFRDCLTVIEKHFLHAKGLQLYPNDSDEYRTILLSLGETLLKKGEASVAQSIFVAANPPDIDGAIRASRKAGNWRSFFSLSVSTESGDDEAAEEANALELSSIAHDFADEIVSGAIGRSRESHKDAAQILIDYGKNVPRAVDVLISGELWSEAYRVSRMHSRQDLVDRTVQGLVSSAHAMIQDFESRLLSFRVGAEKYVACLKLRKESMKESGGLKEDHVVADDTGSLFSMASNLSNASLRSNASASSVGSVSSVSSFISIGNQNTFSITGDHSSANRHKSKFNTPGGKKKAKKKRSKKQKRVQPGSQEELNGLVAMLKESIVDREYAEITSESVIVLTQIGRYDLATELFKAWSTLREETARIQQERIQSDCDRQKELLSQRAAGSEELLLTLPCESEVDSLKHSELDPTIQTLFSFTLGDEFSITNKVCA